MFPFMGLSEFLKELYTIPTMTPWGRTMCILPLFSDHVREMGQVTSVHEADAVDVISVGTLGGYWYGISKGLALVLQYAV